MKLAPLVLLLAAAAALAPASSRAAQHDRLGPLPGRTRNPLYLLHVQPELRRAAVLEPGGVSLGVDIEHANICDRWVVPGPDGSEVTDLDLEMVRAGISARVGLPFGVELGLEVPLISLTGGVLDASIQGWHLATGLSNGDREFIRDDRFNYRLSRPGWYLRHDTPVPIALGDVILDAQVSIRQADFEELLPGLAARLLVKLPTGRFERGTGSGAPDVALVLLGEWGWRFMTWYGQLGFIALGRTGHLATILRPASFTWAIGLELNVAAPWSIVAQFHGRTAFHSGFEHPVIARSPMGFQVGTRLRLGPIDLGVAFGQDPLALDPTEDMALVASIGGRIPPRKKRGI